MDNNMDKSADEPSTSKQKKDESHEKRDNKKMGDHELFEQQIDLKDLFGMNMLLESGGEKPRNCCIAIC